MGWSSGVSPQVCSHLAELHTAGQHDQGVTLLLPHQAPEITYCMRQGTLSCNELLGAPETLAKENRQVTTVSALPF